PRLRGGFGHGGRVRARLGHPGEHDAELGHGGALRGARDQRLRRRPPAVARVRRHQPRVLQPRPPGGDGEDHRERGGRRGPRRHEIAAPGRVVRQRARPGRGPRHPGRPARRGRPPMTTGGATDPLAARPALAAEHFGVLSVGAGISGVGAAYHLTQQCPGTTFVVLEAQPTFGGTWITHRFPGIRSDSDLYTFGYRFKPWTGAPIATAAEILKYMGEAIDDNDLARHIRYRHRIDRASWSSAENRWT